MKYVYTALFYATITFHCFILLYILIGAILSLFLLPFYIALFPLVVMLMLASTRNSCIITSTENYFARKIGKPEVKYFIRDRILIPLGLKEKVS